MTAVDTRPPEADLDLTPWQCPKCGYANQGIRGFCAGCRRPRPEREPEPAVRQSQAPARKQTSKPRPLPPPAPPSRPAPGKFGAREAVASVLIVIVFVGGVSTAVARATQQPSSVATDA